MRYRWRHAFLSVVLDYDSKTAQGAAMDAAIAALRKQTAKHESGLIDSLAETLGMKSSASEMQTVALRNVQPGMTFVDELRSDKGTLLIPAGFEVNDALSERMRNYDPVLLATQVRVMVKTTPKSSEASSEVA